ncbi:MAG TPA: PqqD family protein [Blastocatellia bacterium]|nr:PqqD family protein [Blastocatellia bacterium]
MSQASEQKLPRARRDGLVVEVMADEVLVYDMDQNRGHCLNHAAALIWEHCDGKVTIKELASILERDLKTEVDERAIWYGLNQLSKFRLLDEPVAMPASLGRLTRRELVKRIGLTVSVPLIISIIAPTASAALSCVGVNCNGNPSICGSQCTCDTSVVPNRCI